MLRERRGLEERGLCTTVIAEAVKIHRGNELTDRFVALYLFVSAVRRAFRNVRRSGRVVQRFLPVYQTVVSWKTKCTKRSNDSSRVLTKEELAQ